MSLSSLQLDAFSAVAATRSFSRAAQSLGLTQSALSQRVLNLESDLGAAVFVRDPAGVRLTEVGEELLRYCRTRQGLEEELRGRLPSEAGGKRTELRGTVRVGAFSSVMRSVVMPSLGPVLREHPRLQIELVTRELRDLADLLARGEVDLLITTHAPRRATWVSLELGAEEYVLCEATRATAITVDETFLDHDPDDTTTLEYLRLQGRKTAPLRRRYLDEIYAIVDGVRLGWGRAVLPRHLIRNDATLREVVGRPAAKPLRVPVFLQYADQPYYPKLHAAVVGALTEGARPHLG